MNFIKIYLKDLVDNVMDKYLPFVENLSSMLSPDPVQGTKAILRLTKATLLEFESYLPMCRTFELSNSTDSFVFYDNYEKWLSGEDEMLNQVPLTIVSVGKGNWTLTSNYWKYRSNTLYISPGNYTIKSFCNYPFYVKLDANSVPTIDTHIYGFDNASIQQFYNLYDLTMLRAIKSRAKAVSLPFTVDFFNLDEMIAELKDQVDSDKASAASLMYRWD